MAHGRQCTLWIEAVSVKVCCWDISREVGAVCTLKLAIVGAIACLGAPVSSGEPLESPGEYS
eukprot:12410689-Alexandrium_andersonii.AAC.1